MSNNGSRIQIPGQGPPSQVIQQMQVAQPMNDIQLIVLAASQLPGTAAERVALAQDIVLEALAGESDLVARIKKFRESQG